MNIVYLQDDVSEYDIERLNQNRPLDVSLEQLIVAYKYESYSGSGVAVYLDNKGDWHLDEINHCSCNGAFDGGFNKIPYTREQIIKLLEKNIADNSYRVDQYRLVLAEMNKEA